MNFVEFCKKIRVIIRAKSSVWAAIRETLQRLFARIVKRRMEGPFRAESGPVDDIRGQFRNCVSVEFAVGANDRKTRSADMPRGARATGALS